MNLALANGETVLKSWDYGKKKGLFLTKGTYTLTVTNKKIISTYEGKKESSRDDFDLSGVTGVSVSYKMKRRLIFFKTGSLSVTLYGAPTEEISLVGISSLRASGFFARLFSGKTKIKVDVNCAKDIVNSLSSLIFKNNEAQV